MLARNSTRKASPSFPFSIFWKRSFVDCCALRRISSDRLWKQGWYRSFLPNRVSHHQVKSRAKGQSRDRWGRPAHKFLGRRPWRRHRIEDQGEGAELVEFVLETPPAFHHRTP